MPSLLVYGLPLSCQENYKKGTGMFKVGDKVKCIEKLGSFKIGNIYTVFPSLLNGPDNVCVNPKNINDGNGWYLNSNTQKYFVKAENNGFPSNAIEEMEWLAKRS